MFLCNGPIQMQTFSQNSIKFQGQWWLIFTCHFLGSRSSNEEVEDEEEPEGEDLEDSEEDDDRPKKKKKKERYG